MFPEFEKESSNLIKLTARQHFIAHWLLWKTYSNLEMSRAFHLMHSDKQTSRAYESVRKNVSEFMKGNTNFGSSKGELNGFYGKTHTEENRKAQSERAKALYKSGKFKAAHVGNGHLISGENNPFYGKTHTEETLKKIREASNSISILTCPHCSKIIDARNASRWHFDKCKQKP